MSLVSNDFSSIQWYAKERPPKVLRQIMHEMHFLTSCIELSTVRSVVPRRELHIRPQILDRRVFLSRLL